MISESNNDQGDQSGQVNTTVTVFYKRVSPLF